MSFSHHFHRHHYAPAPVPAPQYYNPTPYAQPIPSPSPYVNAQGVAVAPPGKTYYDPMTSPIVVPPQYNESATYGGYDHHRFGVRGHLKNRLSQKYHLYSDVPYQQQAYDPSGYPQQQYDASGYLNNRDNQQNVPAKQLPNNNRYETQPPSPAPLELSHEYIAAASGSSSLTAPIIPGTPPTIHTPLPPTHDFSPLPNGRPRSLPHISTPAPATPPTTAPSVAPSTTPDRPRQFTRSNSSNSNRLSGSHNHSSSRRSTAATATTTGSVDGTSTSNRTVVAAIPTNMAHEERRQLALNLLSEIDAYERMQNRVFLFRLLPPLRFRVTVVRNIDGVPQQTETMMTMAELRIQLQHALEHDSQMVDQLGMTYENLVGLTRVQLGVKDVTMFPTFTYTQDCHIPTDKSTCSVCLSDFQEGDTLKTVPCMHLFHTECIDEWLKMSKVCPVCKTCVEDESAIPDDDDDCHKLRRPVTISP